jgi:MFS family permease
LWLGAYLKVLKNRDFALLWAGPGVSDLGSQINFIALTLLIIDLTGQVVPVSLLFIVLALPAAVLGPWAGVLVDRWNKKTVIIFSDIIRGLLAIAMPLPPVWCGFMSWRWPRLRWLLSFLLPFVWSYPAWCPGVSCLLPMRLYPAIPT